MAQESYQKMSADDFNQKLAAEGDFYRWFTETNNEMIKALEKVSIGLRDLVVQDMVPRDDVEKLQKELNEKFIVVFTAQEWKLKMHKMI